MSDRRSVYGRGELSTDQKELLDLLIEEEGLDLTGEERIPRREHREGPVPLSFAQERLWFLEQLNPGTSTFHINLAVRVRGALDIGVLERVLTEIERRHEVLRSTLHLEGETPVQVVRPERTHRMVRIDARRIPEERRIREVRHALGREFARPFDLERGPLVRSTLVVLEPGEFIVSLTMHHIISDRWSREVLLREICTLYESFSAGRSSPLDELPIQYGDFAAWQREHLTGERLEEQLSYWREQLRNVPRLNLPTDRPRPTVQRFTGRRESLRLSPDLTASVRRLAERLEATLFMILTAAFQMILARYCGQRDVAIGSPIAGRTRPEIDEIVGFFVNTMVLRSDLSGDPSFEELVEQVRELALEAYSHQDLPFEKLVQELEVDRDLSHTPLFQVLLVLQNVPRGSREIAEIELTPFAVPDRSAKFELSLSLEDEGDRLEGILEFATDLFDRTTVKRLKRHFVSLLGQVVEHPDRPLSRIELLSPAERQQLVVEWSQRDDVTAAVVSLAEGVRRWVEATPDAVAVSGPGATLTYGELGARTARLASKLRSLGVGPETRVGLFLARSTDMVTAVLGVLEAGGTYAPIDPSYPAERIAFLMEDTRAPVLITEPDLAESLPELDAELLYLEPGGWREMGRGEGRPHPPRESDRLAYVMYTSGSTGRPKGVMITHRNVLRLLASTRHSYAFGAADTWSLFHSYAFDVSTWEIYGALLHGGRVLVVPYLVSRSPDELLGLLERERVTVLSQTPSAFQQLVSAETRSDRAAELSLRWVVFGGEALDPAMLEPWFERHGDREPRLVNMYGITETTVHSTYREIGLPDLREPVRSMVGRPLRDLEIQLLEPALKPVPIGGAGEIYVGGGGVARGYYERPGLTAERFVPNPTGGRPGDRLYRSGDLARWSPDGDLEYLGRIDKQVKVRGFRVELREIEQALAAHPNVSEAVVTMEQRDSGTGRLVSYVVPVEAGSSASALRGFLRERLPEYMVPASFVVLDELPLTAHGKVDFERLPSPSLDRPELDEGFVAPRNPVEETLAAIWGAALGLDRVGVHDNFFDLGGDSILAVRAVALAGERGLGLSLQQLFRAQTVAELAREVDEIDGVTVGPELPELSPFDLVPEQDRPALPSDLEDAYPLTSLQAGMLYHMQLEPERPLYHNVNSFHLRLPLNETALRESVQSVVDRHPIFRTGFELTSFSEPLQLVHPGAEMEIGFHDLRDLSHQEQETELALFAGDEAERRFDPARPPLLRLNVHRRTDESFQLTLTEFHPILDGWSLQSSLAEIFDHYLARLEDRIRPEPPPLSTSFRDFVYLERRARESGGAREFWRRRCRGAPFTELPPRSRAGHPEGPVVWRPDTPVPSEVSEGLHALARSAAAPIKSVLLAAHLKVLSGLSGEADVTGGLASHGRPEVEDGDQIRGLFLNTLPFRLRLEPGTWIELVRRTFSAELEMIPHRRYPLSAIQSDRGVQALFDTQFNYVHFHVLKDVFESREVGIGEMGDVNVEETHFALVAAFGSDILSGRVYFHLYGDRTRFTEEQIRTFGSYYLHTLAAMAEQPEARHECFGMLSEEEVRSLQELAGSPFRSTTAGMPSDPVERIVELVDVRGDRQALVGVGPPRTFRDLALTLREAAAEQPANSAPIPVPPPRDTGAVEVALRTLATGADLLATIPSDPAGERAEERLGAGEIAASSARLRALVPFDEGDGVALIVPSRGWRTTWSLALWGLGEGCPLSLLPADAEVEALLQRPTWPTGSVLCLPAGWLGPLAERFSESGAPPALRKVVAFADERVSFRHAERLRAVGVEVLALFAPPGVPCGVLVAGGPGGRAASGDLDRLWPGPGCRAILRGPFGEAVPTGTPGRLLLEVGRPATDEEQPVDTGYLARLLPTGGLRLLGPVDRQVRLGGARVDPVMVAETLEQLEGVREAVVLGAEGREEDGGRSILAAYVAGDGPLDEEAIRRAAQEHLEPLSVPARFEVLERLPRRDDHSVALEELPSPEAIGAWDRPQVVAPRTQLERRIRDVWKEVLTVEEIGVHDNFFDLGGRSLQMLQAHQKLQAALGRDVPLMANFRFPTIGALAGFLGEGEEQQPDFEGREARAETRAAAMQRQRARRRRRRTRHSAESYEDLADSEY